MGNGAGAIKSVIYDLLTAVLSIPATIGLSFSERGRAKLWQRFGLGIVPPRNALWLHAASLGEVQGIIPLVKELQRDNHYPLVVTTTSVSGLKRIEGLVAASFLLPFDSRFFLDRLIRKMQPLLFVFSETEIWPGLLKALERANVPRLMINARLTEAASKKYQLLSFLFSKTLSTLDYVGASESLSLERLRNLGVNPKVSEVTGNTKYDQNPKRLTLEQIKILKRDLHIEDLPLIVLGSIRPEEERVWFKALQNKKNLQLACCIVPRHQEKIGYFKQALDDFKIPYTLRSAPEKHEKIILVDTVGELTALYQIGDAAFIGATLVESLGGHNPLEAALFATPIILGPYGEVIQEIRYSLEAKNAYYKISSVQDAEDILEKIADRDPQLKASGLRAQQVAESFQGATAKIVKKIQEFVTAKSK